MPRGADASKQATDMSKGPADTPKGPTRVGTGHVDESEGGRGRAARRLQKGVLVPSRRYGSGADGAVGEPLASAAGRALPLAQSKERHGKQHYH